jgi:hypothetical protein
MHGFGVKTQGLAMYADSLTSADSLAWSYWARRDANKGIRHCDQEDVRQLPALRPRLARPDPPATRQFGGAT